MGKTIKPEQIASEIADILKEFGEATNLTVAMSVEKTARDTAHELRTSSPSDRGTYAKNWQYMEDPRKRGKNRKAMVVLNRKTYRLTHLLEKGHAKRGGGRTSAQPHIGPAADNAEKELIDEIKKGIQKQ